GLDSRLQPAFVDSTAPSRENHNMSTVVMPYELLEAHAMAVDRVEHLLKLVTSALNEARIPYAVIGGNAGAAWVASRHPPDQRRRPARKSRRPAGHGCRHSENRLLPGLRRRHSGFARTSQSQPETRCASHLRRRNGQAI